MQIAFNTFYSTPTSTNCSSPGVSLPEHSVTVTRHDLAGLEGLPDELLELFLGEIVADLFAKLLQPDKYLNVYRSLHNCFRVDLSFYNYVYRVTFN